MSKMVKTAKGMLYRNTPIEDYRKEYGLWVKRERILAVQILVLIFQRREECLLT